MIDKNKLVDEIHRRMLLKLNNKFDKSTGSFAYDILQPPSHELAGLDQKIKEVDTKRNIFNLSGEELDRFILQLTPLKRTPATYAKGQVKITGEPGARVDRGVLVGSVSQTYRVDKGGNLDNTGEGYFDVVCTEPGKDGNADIGVVNHFTMTINRLDTVVNETPIIDGFDVEDDNSYRDRYFKYINLPATSGNVYHYLLWANEIPGVGMAKVHPLWDGDNTVKVVLVDANGQPASEDLVKQVQDHIDPIGEPRGDETYTKWGCGYGEAPIGAFCTVVSAKPISIKVDADLRLVPGTEIEAIENEFKQKMIDRFSSIALDEEINVISLAKIGCIILSIDGVVDYDASTLKLNGSQDNIYLESDEVGVFDEVSFNEIT